MTSAVFDFPAINRILNRRTQLEEAKIEEPALKTWRAVSGHWANISPTGKYQEYQQHAVLNIPQLSQHAAEHLAYKTLNLDLSRFYTRYTEEDKS